MAKRKSPKTRRYRARRFFKRHKPKTISMETLIAGGAIPFMPPADNWSESPFQKLQKGQMEQVMYHLVRGFTGIDVTSGQINIARALNPLDMGEARYWKVLLWSALIGKVRKKVVPASTQLFRKIPLVGRWVS